MNLVIYIYLDFKLLTSFSRLEQELCNCDSFYILCLYQDQWESEIKLQITVTIPVKLHTGLFQYFYTGRQPLSTSNIQCICPLIFVVIEHKRVCTCYKLMDCVIYTLNQSLCLNITFSFSTARLGIVVSVVTMWQQCRAAQAQEVHDNKSWSPLVSGAWPGNQNVCVCRKRWLVHV
jgi:hypothetical protein